MNSKGVINFNQIAMVYKFDDEKMQFSLAMNGGNR